MLSPQSEQCELQTQRWSSLFPTLELSRLKGLYWCPLLPHYNSAERLLLVTFQPRRLCKGWAQGIPGHFHAPAMVLSPNACYIFSFNSPGNKVLPNILHIFIFEWSEEDFSGVNLHGWVSFNFNLSLSTLEMDSFFIAGRVTFSCSYPSPILIDAKQEGTK